VRTRSDAGAPLRLNARATPINHQPNEIRSSEMGSEIIYSDATKLAELIRSNEVSPVEVVQAHLDRIGKARESSSRSSSQFTLTTAIRFSMTQGEI
jgi:hypothetical protein